MSGFQDTRMLAISNLRHNHPAPACAGAAPPLTKRRGGSLFFKLYDSSFYQLVVIHRLSTVGYRKAPKVTRHSILSQAEHRLFDNRYALLFN